LHHRAHRDVVAADLFDKGLQRRDAHEDLKGLGHRDGG
jgi:hypothetical protein